MTKFKQTFDEMVKKNREDFIRFKITHDMYATNPKEFKTQFDHEGEKILAIIRDYENKLCGHSESGQYSKYSANLADKFWSEVRKNYPRIDFVGVKQSF
ncbi:MAG: hypothetical protein Q8P13_03130 [bacterium]|nr:hypothetical protein [bacterium]